MTRSICPASVKHSRRVARMLRATSSVFFKTYSCGFPAPLSFIMLFFAASNQESIVVTIGMSLA